MTEKNKVTRIEVISNNGREYVNRNVKNVKLFYQDDGKTLKIFYNETNENITKNI